MGFLDRFTRDRSVPAKLMSDEKARQLKDMQDVADRFTAANPGAMPDMNVEPHILQAHMAEEAAEAEVIMRVQQHGVEAPAVVRSIRPTDQTDLGGGRKVEFDVSIRPAGGQPFEAQVRQHMTPAQLQGLSEGQAITAKYDPDAPEAALIVGW